MKSFRHIMFIFLISFSVFFIIAYFSYNFFISYKIESYHKENMNPVIKDEILKRLKIRQQEQDNLQRHFS